jgi:hypothetical protein
MFAIKNQSINQTENSYDFPQWIYSFDPESFDIIYNILQDSLKGYTINGMIGSDAFKGLVSNPINIDLKRLMLHASINNDIVYIKEDGMRVIEDWKDARQAAINMSKYLS